MALNKRIILAAAHGAGDPGAVAQGTTEAIEVIQITDKVAHYLRQAGGFEVHVVPHTLNLIDQITWVNSRWANLNDGLAVEIHKNAGGGSGNEVWTPSYPDQKIKDISKHIVDALSEATGLPNRGVKYAHNNRWGRLAWCDDVRTYSLLVEAGFIDVDKVGEDKNNKYARGIANGILRAYKAEELAPAKPAPKATNAPKSNQQIAQEVLAGKWGNGSTRRDRLRQAGYDYSAIQAIVNGQLLKPAPKPITADIVSRVLAGEFGNGLDRQTNLTRAGYDYNTIQAAVNSRLGLGSVATTRGLRPGDSVVVTNPISYDGIKLATSGVYQIIEVKGKRAVIGRNGQVTAAISIDNIRRA